jgi:hypothetical protein
MGRTAGSSHLVSTSVKEGFMFRSLAIAAALAAFLGSTRATIAQPCPAPAPGAAPVIWYRPPPLYYQPTWTWYTPASPIRLATDVEKISPPKRDETAPEQAPKPKPLDGKSDEKPKVPLLEQKESEALPLPKVRKQD